MHVITEECTSAELQVEKVLHFLSKCRVELGDLLLPWFFRGPKPAGTSTPTKRKDLTQGFANHINAEACVW